MAKKPLPDQAHLLKLLRYEPDTGKIFWRARDPSLMMASGSYSREARARMWNGMYAGKETGLMLNSDGYPMVTLDRHPYRAHRLIWKMITGDDPDVIDHINGDRADNRWCNLRNVTPSENCKNQRIGTRNRSGVMGICWWGGGWYAQIRHAGKVIHLGKFKELSDAVAARKSAERSYGYHPNHGYAPPPKTGRTGQ